MWVPRVPPAGRVSHTSGHQVLSYMTMYIDTRAMPLTLIHHFLSTLGSQGSQGPNQRSCKVFGALRGGFAVSKSDAAGKSRVQLMQMVGVGAG